ncbi:hypothetical protein N7488_006698 [Penicillium malachiteum]|nr:hypothetical protein N7488_006698 [Penicillium malachiteum]
MASEPSTLGYVIIESHPPPAGLISAAKAEVNDRLADFQGAASNEHGYGMLGWGPQCAALFRNQKEVRT